MRYLEIRLAGTRDAHPIRSGELILGRGDHCDIVLDHPSVSRRHARLAIGDEPKSNVVDLGSTNGIWFDGQRVNECVVSENEAFLIGSVTCILRDGVTIEESPTPQDDYPVGFHGDSTDLSAVDYTPVASDPNDFSDPPAEFLPDRPKIQQRLAWALRQRVPGLSLAVIRSSHDVESMDPLLGSPPLIALPTAMVIQPDGATDNLRLVFDPWPTDQSSETEVRFLAELLSAAMVSEIALPKIITPGETTPSDPTPSEVVVDGASRRTWREAGRIGVANMPVLLIGESGVGKELLARHVHDSSPRSKGPFLALNCTAIPKELLEAELFGIEKGVATGVDARPGKFRVADGGTLFLDEIGDLPANLQPKILRALETSEILPLGASGPVPVDVRVVSATNQNLRQMVEESTFRADLYYRLAGAVLEIPALRQRREDIIPLARRFASEASLRIGRSFRGFEKAFLTAVLGYDWPGNVRELKHAIKRSVALSGGPILEARHLPVEVTGNADTGLGGTLLSLREEWRTARDKFARLYFKNLLESRGDNLSEAAKKAGISRSNLYKLLDELKLR